MQFPRSMSMSLAPLANSVDGITEAKDRRAPGGQPGARVGAGRHEQERAAVVEPDGDNEGARDGAREPRERAVDSGRTLAMLALSPQHQHVAGAIRERRRQEGSRKASGRSSGCRTPRAGA